MNQNLAAFLFLLVCFSPVLYQLTVVIREHKAERKRAMKRLKRFSIISMLTITPIITSIGILSHTNYLDYESPIAYDRFDEITFENFRGIELFKKTLYGNEKFAYAVTSIEVSFDDNKTTIQSLFYPSRSFVYDKHSNSNELLTHEKYHIKITELYARMARKKVSEMNQFSKAKIKKILKLIEIAEREFQRKYDYDTFHSYVYGEQKKYEREIDSLLSLHAHFKNPIITIDEKD